MSVGIYGLPRLSDLIDGVPMTPDIVTRLAALALMQAHIVGDALYDTIIPLLPSAKRTFAGSIARRIERGTMLTEDTLRDLDAFNSILTQQIDDGTYVYWEGDEHHVRGGYTATYRIADACELAQAAAEIALLADMILATLSAARAVREITALIDS